MITSPSNINPRQEAERYIETQGLPKRKFETWKHTPLHMIVKEGMLEHNVTKIDLSPCPSILSLKNRCVIRTSGVETTFTNRHIHHKTFSQKSDDLGTILRPYPIDYSVHPLAAWVRTRASSIDYIDVAEELHTELHILHCISSSQDYRSHHTECLIRIGRGTTLTLVEEIASESATVLFNHLTLLQLEQGARLNYVRIATDAQKSPCINGLHLWQDKNTESQIHTLHLGTQKERMDLDIHLQGEEAKTSVYNTIFAQDAAHRDLHVRIHHVAPHTKSTTDMRAVSTDQASSITHSKVMISQGSQEAEAEQNLHHLLLGKAAKAALEPQLEIDTDQVKCTHGANVGQLDEAALHYCQSRGLSKKKAERLLTQAFLAYRFTNIEEEQIQECLETLLKTSLEDYFSHEVNEEGEDDTAE